MTPRMRYVTVGILAVAVIYVGLEVTARLLLAPNRIDLEAEHPYLLETTWHQVGEYARFVPQDDDVGCWATAIAQIAHFHRLNPTGKVRYRTSLGHEVAIGLDDYAYQQDQLVPRIDDTTEAAAREQVARYLFSTAALIYTDFGSSGYLEHETFVERVQKHLGVAVGFHEFTKERFLREQDAIRSLVVGEIDARRPLMLYFDNGKDFGHAAALDGYALVDDRFLVHLNMGSGGKHDGWYDLFDRLIGSRDDLQTRFLVTIAP